MRNWTIGGTIIALLCGSAWADTSDRYRTVREICLFSSFLPPAESAVARRSLNDFGDGFLHDFETTPASKDSRILLSASVAVLAAVSSPLKGMYELRGSDWRSAGSDLLRTESDWINFALSGGADGADDGKMNFTVSSIRALGLEHNGLVAGFNLKF